MTDIIFFWSSLGITPEAAQQNSYLDQLNLCSLIRSLFTTKIV